MDARFLSDSIACYDCTYEVETVTNYEWWLVAKLAIFAVGAGVYGFWKGFSDRRRQQAQHGRREA